ncbi:MAG: 6-bladed beta-propeller [Vicinamibacterales bacterium]
MSAPAGVVALVVACVLIGSGSPAIAQKDGRKAAKGKPEAETVQLTWPLPPDEPRIRYVATYRGLDDFKPAKKPSKFAALLLGAADPSNLSNSLLKPYGIAVAPSGKLYVSDTAARRVFAFERDRKTVAFVGEGRTGRLTKPVGVAVDSRDVVYVADATLKRVFGYGVNGELSIAIGHEGELVAPSGLAIDRAADRLYVADAGKHEVLCYSAKDGALIRVIGKRGGEAGEFNFPTNLSVDAQGRLYVADTLNFRIQVFDRDGKFVRMFGELGDSPGQLNRPKGVAVDSEGHIYVADSSFNNFQVFDEEGRLLLFVGQGGSQAGEFSLPAGLYIDDQDRIYVADQGNSRIQVFQYVKEKAGTRAGGGANQ